MSPFRSKSQERWAYTKEGTKALGGPAKVKEWQSDTPKNLPERLKMKKSSIPAMAVSGLAHKSKPPVMKKRQKEMHIKEAHTGGYIVHKHDGKGGPPTEHVAASMKEVKKHLMDHMGGQPEPPDDEAQEGAQSNPMEEMTEGGM